MRLTRVVERNERCYVKFVGICGFKKSVNRVIKAARCGNKKNYKSGDNRNEEL